MKKLLIIIFLITIIVLSYLICSYIVKQNAEAVIYEDDFYYITYNGNTYTGCEKDKAPENFDFPNEKHRVTLYKRSFLDELISNDYIYVLEDGNYLKLDANSFYSEYEYYEIVEYNAELLELTKVKNDTVYEKEEVWQDIMDIYWPIPLVYGSSGGVFYYRLDPIFEYCNVQKNPYGFTITLTMEDEIFVATTNYQGVIRTMFFYDYDLPAPDQLELIDVGMEFSEVQKIFPELIINDGQAIYPIASAVFEDGTVGIFGFEEKDGKYYVIEKRWTDWPTIPEAIMDEIKCSKK